MPANLKIFAQVDEKNNLSEHLRVCGQDARRSARKIIFCPSENYLWPVFQRLALAIALGFFNLSGDRCKSKVSV